MVKVDARGDVCPVPVIKTRKAFTELNAAETVEVLVDNETSVQNLKRLADKYGFPFECEKTGEAEYRIQIAANKIESAEADGAWDCELPEAGKKNIVVALGSARMGSGNDELGALLMKSYIFALTQQDKLPSTILIYNTGALLSTEGSASLEDLKTLEAKGVEILTCGTCLDFQKLKEKLAVGGVTNMYEIAEKLESADLVIRP